MLKTSFKDLDYATLNREAKRLGSVSYPQQVRIAVLADCASQHLVSLMGVLFAKNDVSAEIYESEFDTIEQEITNPDSGLYQSQPQFIVLIHSVWALRNRFYGSALHLDSFIGNETSRMVHLWDTLHARSKAAIIQSNFVVPYERLYGNFDGEAGKSFSACVQKLNQKMASLAYGRKNIFINDLDYLAGYVGRKHWFDEKMWIMAKALCAYEFLPLVGQNVADIVLSQLGFGVKCVVLDLDNTLWGGIIGDDGLERIRLGHLGDGEAFESFQYFLKALKNRGILLAVVSKNNPENALLPFKKHPDMILKEEDIAVFIANWQNKAENIKQIKEILNIGYDSMVFLDDNPLERGTVKEQIPDLIVPELPEEPGQYVRAITELNLFEASVTSETDQDRTAMYRKEAERKLAEYQYSDPREYLKSLALKITLGRFDDFRLPRILQLMNRSNQFNLMTRRFNEAECREIIKNSESYFPLYAELKDKYGDNGLVAVVILKLELPKIEIIEWLMSCRVLARGVEQCMMNYVFDFARQNGFSEVLGRYRKTAKNDMVKEFYGQFGFEKEMTAEIETCWKLAVRQYIPKSHCIETECLPEMEGCYGSIGD